MGSNLPPKVADELTWELVRDEWELLLAIGSGPTPVSVAAVALGADPEQISTRVAVLASHGLVRRQGEGFGLVPAFYQRREGMSSYLRDLVLRRLAEGGAPPVAGLVRWDLGDGAELAALLAEAERRLYPRVVELASHPEGERSERFSVFFAAAADCPMVRSADEDPLLGDLLCVLRAAAAQRAENASTAQAYLWIAEMRVDPEVASEIGEVFERFLTASPARGGRGAAGFAIVPSARTRQPPSGVEP